MNIELHSVFVGSRRTGSTTWIIRSLARRPNAVLIFSDSELAEGAKRDYEKYVSSLPWLVRMWRRIRKVKAPLFYGLRMAADRSHELQSYGRAVVLDNSVLSTIASASIVHQAVFDLRDPVMEDLRNVIGTLERASHRQPLSVEETLDTVKRIYDKLLRMVADPFRSTGGHFKVRSDDRQDRRY